LSEVNSDDLNRIHERIDRIEDKYNGKREKTLDQFMQINSNLSSINERLQSNDKKTDDLCSKLDEIKEEQMEHRNDIEEHEAECPARLSFIRENGYVRNGVTFAKEHPLVSSGTISAIGVALFKVVEFLMK